MNFGSLPPEMLGHVVFFIDDIPSFTCLAKTCTLFYRITSSSHLGKLLSDLRTGKSRHSIAFFAPNFNLLRPQATILKQDSEATETDAEPGEGRFSMSVWTTERKELNPLTGIGKAPVTSVLEKGIYSVHSENKATCIEFNLDKQVFPFWRDNERSLVTSFHSLFSP